MIIFYFISNDLPDVCHVLLHGFSIFKISVGRWVHPSLIAGEDHSEFAFESSYLEFEAILITIKDSDTSLARLLVGWVFINNMSIRCLVGIYFGTLNPDVAFKRITDFGTDYASGNHT
jgi:hypothetical protein